MTPIVAIATTFRELGTMPGEVRIQPEVVTTTTAVTGALTTETPILPSATHMTTELETWSEETHIQP
jgi:hypothetical protein